MNIIVNIEKDKCTGCGACVKICPNKILYLEKNICKVVDEKKCDKSKGCEKVCPTGAIKIN
jgi:NAD-dependent dihydropyrimidine dehydrogenase PreA subunit